MEYIKTYSEDKIGTIVVNREAVLNALNIQTLKELDLAIDELLSKDVCCVIVKGEGQKAFVAGADISEMYNMSPQEAKEFSRLGNNVFSKLANLNIPSIAAINGFALGGGCELALACDIRICSDRSVFGFPEVKLGLFPGFGGIGRLKKTVGISKTKQLILSGVNIDANTAYSIGLVDEVISSGDVYERAFELAKTISHNSKHAVMAAKELINSDNTDPKNIDCELDKFAQLFNEEDTKARLENFVSKSKKKG